MRCTCLFHALLVSLCFVSCSASLHACLHARNNSRARARMHHFRFSAGVQVVESPSEKTADLFVDARETLRACLAAWASFKSARPTRKARNAQKGEGDGAEKPTAGTSDEA